MFTHTFLFKPGIWKAEGFFTTGQGMFDASGESEVTHLKDRWLIKSVVRVQAEERLEYCNQYEIEPFKQDHLNTVWVTLNDSLGRINGTFVIVDDAILSLFHTPDYAFQGQETLIQTDEHTYRTRGVLLRGQIFISSWAMTMSMETKETLSLMHTEEEIEEHL